jgi:two-component system, chemotaxis family, sensor kinase CheA
LFAAEPDEEEARNYWEISFAPRPELYAKANESAILLRELRRLGEVEMRLDTSRLPELSELDPEGAYLTWHLKLFSDCDEAAIRHVFEFVEDDCVLLISPPEPQCFVPGTVITGDNGFMFEFFPPSAGEEEAAPDMAEVPAEAPPAPVAQRDVAQREVAPREMVVPAPKSQAVEAITAKAESVAADQPDRRLLHPQLAHLLDHNAEPICPRGQPDTRIRSSRNRLIGPPCKRESPASK